MNGITKKVLNEKGIYEAKTFKNKLGWYRDKNKLLWEIIFYDLTIDRLLIALHIEYNNVILQIYLR